MTHLKKGDKAPNFTVNDQDNKPVSLKDFKGQKLVLYFYPKDDTETCTKEACNLRDNYTMLTKKGIAVVGVSIDTERKHRNFIKKYDLPFTLLADVDKKIVEDYGVWGLKKFMGREYMGIRRVTFLINEKGKIDHVIDNVKSAEHTKQILEAWGL